MKARELRELADAELEARVLALRNSLFDLQVKLRTGQLENAASVRSARRNLARALTVAAERRQAR